MDGHRRQAAAVALALGVVLFATALLAPSSGAKPKKVEISASCSGGDPQRCGVPQDVGSWPSRTKISISWAAAEGSCSQFQVIALVDGEEVARSPFSQSGAAIPTFTLPNTTANTP